MEPSLKVADAPPLAATASPPARRFSQMADGLKASVILRIATEIRALVASGQKLCDLTVGDFGPSEFRIPARLSSELRSAIERGETNYPPGAGLPELRQEVARWYTRELGLEYAAESVLVTSGSRPGIYASYRALVDPGDRVVYPVPSWNNDHYTHTVGGTGVPIACGPADDFQPSRAQVRATIPGARLLCLCTPSNPTGTVIARDVLAGISEDVLRENQAREARGERPLYVLYDQVYWTLSFGVRHYTPPGLVPGMERYTVLIDGISKAFAATGLRVGWAVGPLDVIVKMNSLIGHLGAWAPRPEQVATIALLRDEAAVRSFQADFHKGVQARLDALSRGLRRLKASGLPVDCLPPAGAMYLTARIAPFGRRTPDGVTLRTNEEVRRYVLTAAQLAAVPFQAFGSRDEDGWFRLSVGAVSLADIEAALPRLEAALRALA